MRNECLPTSGWINRSSGVIKENSNSQVILHINPTLGLAHVHGYLYTPTSVSDWTHAFTLPNDAKPSSGCNFIACDATSNVKAALTATGRATYIGGGIGTYNNFTFTYLLA